MKKTGYLGTLEGIKNKKEKSFTLHYDRDDPKLYSRATITVGDKVISTDKALWDTGATMICIQHYRAKCLKDEPKETGTSVSATDRRDSDIYLGTVELPGGIIFYGVDIWDIDLANLEAEVIIGMDIISKGRLVVDTVDGIPAFSFTVMQ